MTADGGTAGQPGVGVTGPAETGPLAQPDWLARNLDSPGVAVLEVRRNPVIEPEDAGGVPGAARVYWKDLLWDPKRRDFADPKTLADRLGALGISNETEVVICGDPVQFGTYAYWTLKMSGHPRIRVLDGGKAYWQRLGLPLSPDRATRDTRPYRPGRADRSSRIGREEVLGALGSEVTIVDLRTDEEYLGVRVAPRTHPIDHGAEARGRIPGARHLFYQRLLTPDGRFLEPAEVAERFRSAGIALDRPVVLYCRLGHRASLGWFCLSEILGSDSARVYDGSWTEWGSMVGMPVER